MGSEMCIRDRRKPLVKNETLFQLRPSECRKETLSSKVSLSPRNACDGNYGQRVGNYEIDLFTNSLPQWGWEICGATAQKRLRREMDGTKRLKNRRVFKNYSAGKIVLIDSASF